MYSWEDNTRIRQQENSQRVMLWRHTCFLRMHGSSHFSFRGCVGGPNLTVIDVGLVGHFGVEVEWRSARRLENVKQGLSTLSRDLSKFCCQKQSWVSSDVFLCQAEQRSRIVLGFLLSPSRHFLPEHVIVFNPSAKSLHFVHPSIQKDLPQTLITNMGYT